MRILMIGGAKGGIGKTTSAVNLAHELGKKGKKVLIIDLDAQANCSSFFVNFEHEYDITNILLDHTFDPKKAMQKCKVKGEFLENVSIISGKKGNAITKLEIDLASLPKREERLAMQLKKLEGEIDFVIIDTAPTFNVLLMNAIEAAEEYVFPTEYKTFALEGIDTLLGHIQQTKLLTDEDEIDFMVLPVVVDKRKKSFTHGEEYLAERFPNNKAQTTIWSRADFEEAERALSPLSAHMPGSGAAMYYKNFAKEVIENVI